MCAEVEHCDSPTSRIQGQWGCLRESGEAHGMGAKRRIFAGASLQGVLRGSWNAFLHPVPREWAVEAGNTAFATWQALGAACDAAVRLQSG
jgi:hypothetical protein